MSIHILNERILREVLSYDLLLQAIEEAMLVYDSGDFLMPDRLHLDQGSNTFLYMPSIGGEFAATKLVSVFPANKAKGLPAIMGTVLLNDGTTGKPLALLDGSALTALRTGSIAGVAARYLSPENSHHLGVIGTGVQGIEATISICHARPITHIFAYNRSPEPLARFKTQVMAHCPKVTLEEMPSSAQVLEKASLILTATTSSHPVLPNQPELLEGKQFIAIGSYKPDMQELPDSLFPLLQHLYLDVHLARKESGDVKRPLEKGLLQESQLGTLAPLVKSRQISPDTTTCFKSVGMALFDLVVAGKAYRMAREKGLGVEVDFL